MNFFRAGLAADFDGDGLTDGYEALVSLTGLNTMFSPDGDDLPDGWEVEYVLDPLAAGINGNDGNPDVDALLNLQEFTSSTDPKRHNDNLQPRPVVSISVTDPNAAEGGDTANFRITRSGSLANSLTVYYVLGGSATVGSDYTLNPNPTEPYPGYSITIPAGSETRDLLITPVNDALVEGTETVIIGLMPNVSDQYVVATSPHRAMATIRDRVCHTYELDADFLSGVLVGTEARNNQLHLQASSHAQFPYVNVACSRRNTVVRIDAEPGSPAFGTAIGEYRTVPERINGSTSSLNSPSRTTVDQYGNVWVGNRYDSYGSPSMGSVTRIGLIIGTRYLAPGNPTPDPAGFYVKIATATYNTCVDRNGDGYIKTSTGIGSSKVLSWPNLNEEDSNGGVSTAEDEAITEYVRVPSTGVRSIAVDKYNDVWIGSDGLTGNNGKHCKVDGLIGQLMTDSTFDAAGCGGYGGAITRPTVPLPNGVLWSANYGGSTLRLELPTSFSTGWPPVLGTVCHNIDFPGFTGNAYGIAAHPTSGEVWQTLYDQSGQNNFGLIRWHADGTLYTVVGGNLRVYVHGGGNAKGLVIDDNQNIWVAHAEGNTVGRLRFNSQTSDWEPATPITLPDYRQDQQPNQPYGVAVDSSGKIWAANYLSHTAMRIDPLLNSGNGAVDLVVDLNLGWAPGNEAYPYNYSDMTGFNNHIVNPDGCPLKGYWTVIENGVAPNGLWNVSWIPNTPAGTRIDVYARASDDRLTLSNEEFVPIANGILIPGVRGQFLEVRTVLAREACGQDPYLENLKICSLSKTLTLIASPTDQSVQEGQDAAFEVVAIGTEPLNYQWFLNGSPVGPNSSVLSLLSVDCLDSGQYSVHITDASGDEVDAGPAFLDVYPRIVTIPLVGTASVYPMQITVSGATTISSVEVVINGFKHDRPADVDILLVPPSPAPAIMLMSDAGGSTAVQNLTLTFSQSGFLPPDEGQLFTGTFAPANFGEQETSFPAANPNPPAGPYSTDLSLLNGINPNGVWSLYIVDDTNQRSGFISGSWCLILNP